MYLSWMREDIHPHNKTCLKSRKILPVTESLWLRKTILVLVEEQVVKHNQARDGDNARDMMDLFLNEIQNTTDPNSSFYGSRGHYAMINDHIELFLAGMETTSTSLAWTFLYLLHHPDIKHRIHKEIDEVIPKLSLKKFSTK